jgi:hypothetical protein
MIRAAVEGGRAAQEGREAVLRTKSESADQLSDIGKQLIALGERSRDREFQAEEAQKDRSARSTEATKERAFRGAESERDRSAREAMQTQELSAREKIEARQAAQYAAEHELEQTSQNGGSGAAATAPATAQSQVAEFPGGNVPDVNADPQVQQRLAQTQADMQRGEAQRNKETEVVRQGDTTRVYAGSGEPSYRKSQSRQEREAAERAARVADEKEKRALRLQRAELALNRDDDVAAKEMRHEYEAPMRSDWKLRDAFGKGTIAEDDPAWGQLEESLNDPILGEHPSQELMNEIRTRANPAPHVARFLSNRIAMDGLKMTAQTGMMPSEEVFDSSNPIWGRFKLMQDQVHAQMGQNPFIRPRDMQHKNRIVNKTAAAMMMLVPSWAQAMQSAGQQQQPGAQGANEQPPGPPGAAVQQPQQPGRSGRPGRIPGRAEEGF